MLFQTKDKHHNGFCVLSFCISTKDNGNSILCSVANPNIRTYIPCTMNADDDEICEDCVQEIVGPIELHL